MWEGGLATITNKMLSKLFYVNVYFKSNYFLFEIFLIIELLIETYFEAKADFLLQEKDGK